MLVRGGPRLGLSYSSTVSSDLNKKLLPLEGVCVCVCECVYELSHVPLFVTPWTVARQAPLSTGFSWQEYWSGLSLPSPK